MRLDVSRAAQLSTGIWEAADTAQRLLLDSGDDAPRSPSADSSGDLPQAWRTPEHSAPPRDPVRRRRRRPVASSGAATDATRLLGLRIRRIRHARAKSLRVVSGLAGMSSSKLHRIEHGRREPTLSEIVALARALRVTPATLTNSPLLAGASSGRPDQVRPARCPAST